MPLPAGWRCYLALIERRSDSARGLAGFHVNFGREVPEVSTTRRSHMHASQVTEICDTIAAVLDARGVWHEPATQREALRRESHRARAISDHGRDRAR
jgi:hypothetical protein